MSSGKQFYQKIFSAVVGVTFCWASIAQAQSSAKDDLRIQALYAEPGKPSVYEIAFTTKETLPPEAEFSFEFPAEFDLAQLQIAGSPDMKGGFTLKRDKQKVVVQRSGLGQSVASGTLVRLRLGAIVNPKNLESSRAVAMQVRLSARSAWTTLAKQSIAFMAAKKSE